MKPLQFPAGCLLLLLLIVAVPGYPQQPVSLRNTHERVLCIVPMTGSGTDEDPRRPMFAPTRAERAAKAAEQAEKGEKSASRSGIIAYTYQESDDGRMALVEFVALDRAAFEPILAEKNSDIRVFVKGKARKAEIETEFRQLKRDFEIERFRVNVP